MGAALAGDAAAWETLVRRFGPLVHSIAARCGLEGDDRADVFQTVFVQVYRGLHLLDRPEALAGWIRTIARREAWRQARRARADAEREGRLTSDAHGPTPPAPPDDLILRTERAFLVERGLARIDARCRELLRLLFYASPRPDYLGAARRLNVPVGSLGPTRARCLEKLRNMLEGMGFTN